MPDSNTPDSNEVKRKIHRMLTLNSDEEILAELVGSPMAVDERDRKIEGLLEEMIAEVDDLLLRMDDLEDQPLNGCSDSRSIR